MHKILDRKRIKPKLQKRAHTRHFAYATQNMKTRSFVIMKIRNAEYKYQVTSHLVCLSSHAFPHGARDLVIRMVSHSRLGEPRPICKIWYVKAEGVVSFVKPELTTYSLWVRESCFVRKAWTYNLQTQIKFWVSEGVVSIVKPDLTTYRHKGLTRFRQHCAPSEGDKDQTYFAVYDSGLHFSQSQNRKRCW